MSADTSSSNQNRDERESIRRLVDRAVGLHRRGRLDEAGRAYRAVLAQDPANAVALRALGWMALEAGQVDESIAYYRRVLSARPGDSETASELAQVLVRAGKFDEALEQAAAAARQAPDNSMTHFIHGSILADCGDFRGAASAYRTSIEIDPHNPRPMANLLELELDEHDAVSAAEAERFSRLLDEPGLGHRARARLHFGLAAFEHRRGRRSHAFAHWDQANLLKRRATPQQMKYAPQQERQRFAIQRDFFKPDFFARRRDWGLECAQPVFIVGMPRTGSTLVEQILAAHPDVEARSELMYLRLIALDQLPRMTGRPYPDALLQLTRAQVRRVARQYLRQVFETDRGDVAKPVPVDKMPTNYEHLGVVRLLFPNARIVHTHRDPMSTLWSCYRHDLNASFTNSFDDLVSKYRVQEQYMRLWRERLGVRIFDCDYESLVAAPERKIRELLDFVGLDWDDRCLSPEQAVASVATASRQQVRRPIHAEALAPWKNYERCLKPLVSLLEQS